MPGRRRIRQGTSPIIGRYSAVPVVDPADVQQALLETDLQDNPYGPINFDDYQGYRNQNPLPMVVQQIQDGEFVTVFVDGEVVGDIIFPTPGWSER